MALVMLPCDLPWWPTLVRHLTQLAAEVTGTDTERSAQGLVDAMHRIHALCSVGLDPDEPECPDPRVFAPLQAFLTTELSATECTRFYGSTLPAMVQRALDLKRLRPPSGLHYSLQQQADRSELDREFVASLLAHCFFSTFPRRTPKTHPTLLDFSFANFFRNLDQDVQKAKLRSFLYYFDVLERTGLPVQNVVMTRQVMSGREWLTVEDWLECGLPLCPLMVRHEVRLERTRPDGQSIICFASAHVGGRTLCDGASRECIQFATSPEMLVAVLVAEALEDNEVLCLENVQHVAVISEPRHRAILETVLMPKLYSYVCMDAENYSRVVSSQYEEDNILRELNKALVGLRGPSWRRSPPPPRRLSPIGESFSSLTPPPEPAADKSSVAVEHLRSRNRFIVLGSSGECLPVTRSPPPPRPLLPPPLSLARYTIATDPPSPDDTEYYSAQSSLSDGEEEEREVAGAEARRYSAQLDTPERRHTFAARLREALCRSETTGSESSSYAVGITVTGSSTADNDIKMRRGGSCGFILEEDRRWVVEGREENAGRLRRGNSSKYSFSTEYSSELEGVYETLGRWLEESADVVGGDEEEGEERRRMHDVAVVRFAGSLLKRTLSESFLGVTLDERELEEDGREEGGREAVRRDSQKVAMAARSLSLELARHKHKLAAQLVSVVSTTRGDPGGVAVRPVATGNWGCGTSCHGDHQLKLLIQWLAASVAGLPHLLYYTCSHYRLLKLDTVCRVVLDRQWSVGELAGAILRFLQLALDNPAPIDSPSIFEHIIGTQEERIALS